MAYSFPSAYDVFVPSFEAAGALVVGYSRNPTKFKLNQYSSLVPISKTLGYYINWYSKQGARIKTPAQFVWPFGQPGATGVSNLEQFQYTEVNVTRYRYPTLLSTDTVNVADWDVLSAHLSVNAQQAMTNRVINAYNALSGASYGSNTATATAASTAGGATTPGKWNTGTGSNPVIQASLNYAVQVITQQTIGGINPTEDLVLVVGPALATAMGQSAEIHNFLAGSPFAAAEIRGDVPSLNAGYGLPSKLYGIRTVIEDTVQVTSNKGAATETVNFIFPSTEAYLLARPGALVGVEGAPNFSSLIGWFYNEMEVETFDDPKERLVHTRVVDAYQYQVASVLGSFRFTACL